MGVLFKKGLAAFTRIRDEGTCPCCAWKRVTYQNNGLIGCPKWLFVHDHIKHQPEEEQENIGTSNDEPHCPAFLAGIVVDA